MDNGSYVNILYYGTYKKMGLLNKKMTTVTTHIYGFTGNSLRVKDVVRMPLTLGEEPLLASHVFELLVIDQTTYYNALIGRHVLK